MQIIVLADASQREELSNGSTFDGIVWIEVVEEFLQFKNADAFIDIGFTNEQSRISLLQHLLPKTVIINSVEATLLETHPSFVRINGWNTFLSSTLIEAATLDEAIKGNVENVFAVFNKKIAWQDDKPGFIAPRVVSAIINEALFALQEGTSTREEIDTAMQLGTAYPFGPFQWAEKIGPQKVDSLINGLQSTPTK